MLHFSLWRTKTGWGAILLALYAAAHELATAGLLPAWATGALATLGTFLTITGLRDAIQRQHVETVTQTRATLTAIAERPGDPR